MVSHRRESDYGAASNRKQPEDQKAAENGGPSFLILNTPERIRTSDPRIRSPVLYPAELRARVKPYQYVTLKKRLQDAEESFGFEVELFHVEGFRHEDIGAGLRGCRFRVRAAADGNNDRFVAGVGLDAAADFHSIDAGNHDIQNEEVGFYAADFEECRDTVGSCRNFITALPQKKDFTMIDDFALHRQRSER